MSMSPCEIKWLVTPMLAYGWGLMCQWVSFKYATQNPTLSAHYHMSTTPDTSSKAQKPLVMFS